MQGLVATLLVLLDALVLCELIGILCVEEIQMPQLKIREQIE
jgi:hypothetical protein